MVSDVLDMHPDLKQRVLDVRTGNTNARSRVNWDLAAEVDSAYKKELVIHWKNSGRKKIPVILKRGDP